MASEDKSGLYVEPPELLARDLWTGSRLFTAAMAFLFISFLFAFFYLRSLNANGMWRPHGVSPPMGYGSVILACVLVSAGVFWLGTRLFRSRGEGTWRAAAVVALGLGVAAIVIQCVEWAAMTWGPTNGGYASVFIGWTGFFLATLLGGVYWMETLVAESVRGRRDASVREQVVVRQANAEALALFWGFLAVVEIAAYVVLYAVA